MSYCPVSCAEETIFRCKHELKLGPAYSSQSVIRIEKRAEAGHDFLKNMASSLQKFAKLLPSTYHYLSASTFSIYNQPEIVPGIFRAAHAALSSENSLLDSQNIKASELLLARQFREALLRAGIFGGMSKAINVSRAQ